jgi:hypothetical protein
MTFPHRPVQLLAGTGGGFQQRCGNAIGGTIEPFRLSGGYRRQLRDCTGVSPREALPQCRDGRRSHSGDRSGVPDWPAQEGAERVDYRRQLHALYRSGTNHSSLWRGFVADRAIYGRGTSESVVGVLASITPAVMLGITPTRTRAIVSASAPGATQQLHSLGVDGCSMAPAREAPHPSLRAGNAPLGCAARNGFALARGVLPAGDPGPSEASLDIFPNQLTHDLRGSEVLFGTQPFQYRLLARVDQNGKSCRALLELHNRGFPHSHPSYTVG